LYVIWNYVDATAKENNAWRDSGSVGDFIDKWINDKSATNMVGFLQAKIGSNDGTKNTGMCMSVLNQCQNFTYTGTNKGYAAGNDVVRQYLTRSLATIKARQDGIIAEFAASCITRVASCLSSNGAHVGSSVASDPGDVSYASYNACRALVDSCASVNNDATTGKVGLNVISTAICSRGTVLKQIPDTNTTEKCAL
jgi:hypothetical protein